MAVRDGLGVRQPFSSSAEPKASNMISCFIPHSAGSPLDTLGENSHLVKLLISSTMTPLCHLLDYRFVQVPYTWSVAARKEQGDSNDNVEPLLS